MRQTRLRTVLLGLVLLVALPGCGGCSVERDKNSDLDRPKVMPKTPEKK
ncbi:MAG: hypothetical protein U0792_19935 [Gemmataceae bacterium]